MASCANPQPSGDPSGLCSLCKAKPEEVEKVNCLVCGVTWHSICLVSICESDGFLNNQWGCPKCQKSSSDIEEREDGAFSGETIVARDGPSYLSPSPSPPHPPSSGDNNMVAKILAIQADNSLTEEEKARKRQELIIGKSTDEESKKKEDDGKNKSKGKEKMKERELDALTALDDDMLNCSICLNMLDRPVTTPCGHNFCLKCFQSSIRKQTNRTCPLCRKQIPQAMANQPRINVTLVNAIRFAKASNSNNVLVRPVKVDFVHNKDRPDQAFTTERAKKSGLANASSGRIFVTVPVDHFGPILAENDPERNRGVLVGDTWEDRLHCRQWGAHFPPIKGIAGQQDHGAQSVVLSGGYQDDEDHGEWFLYTGSGGRDLSGNKRTNKDQSFDQEFKSGNESLRLSCLQGYPVRVIRSFKYKHSSYAPEEKGLRYDGIYRVEKCWRNEGVQGFKVCRYLFVRCDNDPAPWTSEQQGDRPRPLPVVEELQKASNITERKESPSWNFDEVDGRWKWFKPAPISKHKEDAGNSSSASKKRPRITVVKPAKSVAAKKRLLKVYGCFICKQILEMPVTTPCAHNFCKSCLEGAFAGEPLVKMRNAGGRALRSQRTFMKCPACPTDLSEYLNNLQVNLELKALIANQVGKWEISENLGEDLADQNSNKAEEDDSEEADHVDDDDGSCNPEKIKTPKENEDDGPPESSAPAE